MYIENRGQHPRLNKFYLITTLLGISVDQFFFPCSQEDDNNRRKQIDVLLNDMEEKELIVVEATAQGLKMARETAELFSIKAVKSNFLSDLSDKRFGIVAVRWGIALYTNRFPTNSLSLARRQDRQLCTVYFYRKYWY